jgi:hypothetical protein
MKILLGTLLYAFGNTTPDFDTFHPLPKCKSLKINTTILRSKT